MIYLGVRARRPYAVVGGAVVSSDGRVVVGSAAGGVDDGSLPMPTTVRDFRRRCAVADDSVVAAIDGVGVSDHRRRLRLHVFCRP